jgi:hypothetical protein
MIQEASGHPQTESPQSRPLDELENVSQSVACHSIHFLNFFRGFPGEGTTCYSGVNKRAYHHETHWFRQFIACE